MITNVLIPFLVAGILISLIIYLAVFLPGKVLRRKFAQLGELKGLSRAQIVSRCGKYHSKRPVSGGYVCVWMIPGFVISVVFDAEDKAVRSYTKSPVGEKSRHLKPALTQ